MTIAKNEVFMGYNMRFVIYWGNKPLVGGIYIW